MSNASAAGGDQRDRPASFHWHGGAAESLPGQQSSAAAAFRPWSAAGGRPDGRRDSEPKPPAKTLVQFTVCDTGSGVPFESQKHLFLPFRRGGVARCAAAPWPAWLSHALTLCRAGPAAKS